MKNCLLGLLFIILFSSSQTVVTINVLNYGAVGNGIVDDGTAIQSAIDAALPGQTVYFPAGTYRVTLPVYWKSNVNMLGDGENSLIYNDRDVFDGAGSQCPVFFGNYSAGCYNEDQLIYRSIKKGTNYRVVVTDLARYAVGQIVFIRSVEGFFGTSGQFKPNYMVQNVITRIGANYIILKYPLDIAMSSGLIAIDGDFYSGSGSAADHWQHATYAITNCNITNMAFKSKGQVQLFLTLLKSKWSNVWMWGSDGFGGNMMGRWTCNNIHVTFGRQVVEVAIGSNNSSVTTMDATFNAGLVIDSERKPLIRFGENSRTVTFDSVVIAAGAGTGTGITFDETSDCSVTKVHVVGTGIQKDCIEFNNSNDLSINRNNVVSLATFAVGVNLNKYVEILNNTYTNAVLDANTVINCSFSDVIGSSTKTIDEGTNSTINITYP